MRIGVRTDRSIKRKSDSNRFEVAAAFSVLFAWRPIRYFDGVGVDYRASDNLHGLLFVDVATHEKRCDEHTPDQGEDAIQNRVFDFLFLHRSMALRVQ